MAERLRPCIAVDFDGTWTARPRLLREFALDAIADGDVVVIATSRRDTEANRLVIRAVVPAGIIVVCCGGRYKRDVLRQRGFDPIFYIDNQPATDQRPRPLWWERIRGALLTIVGARPEASGGGNHDE